jgi:hypothetical protein
MKTILDIIHSIRGLIYFFIIFFAITVAITSAAFAQYNGAKCPIQDKQLSKMTVVSEVYDSKYDVYIKTFKGDYGVVEVRLHNVDSASYNLHKGQKTIPSTANLMVAINWNGRTKNFFLEEVLGATKQR